MYGYLYKTLLRLASTHMRGPSCNRLRSNESRKIARESFLRGAVALVVYRLMEQKKITPVTSDALVVSKKQSIEAALPDIVSKKATFKKIRKQDWDSGARAAQNVPLSKPLKSARPDCLALG